MGQAQGHGSIGRANKEQSILDGIITNGSRLHRAPGTSERSGVQRDGFPLGSKSPPGDLNVNPGSRIRRDIPSKAPPVEMRSAFTADVSFKRYQEDNVGNYVLSVWAARQVRHPGIVI